MDEFVVNVNACVYDIIIITESWLSNKIKNEEIPLHNFDIYRADRNIKTSTKSRGGGILIAVKKCLNSSVIFIGELVESLFISFRTNGSSFIIAGVYIPPESDFNVSKSHCKDVENVFQKYSDYNFIIAGDFNLPRVKWTEKGTIGYKFACSNHDCYDIVLNTYSFLNFAQPNTIPIDRNVFLDLIFTNITDLEIIPAIDPILGDSLHHISYSWSISIAQTENLETEFCVYDFMNGNYPLLNDYFASICWDKCFEGLGLDEMVAIFYEILSVGMETYIPRKIIRTKPSRYPKWFNSELKTLCHKKIKAHTKFKQSGNLQDYLYFKSLRSQRKKLSKELYKFYVSEANASIISNPKFFWKFVRGRKTSNNNVPSEMSYLNESVTGGKGIFFIGLHHY